MKIEIPDKEIKEELKKYIMNKVKRELRESIDEQLMEIKVNADTFEITFPDLNKKIEKIQDYINDNFGETKGRLYL